ncbi:MAG: integral rane sensor hybrid histidine kinase, partial [Verrucomicrobia bacterium]|nr:integral rane sensor hybrid histidine kinase [Verrucomicrobiota bacterium]
MTFDLGLLSEEARNRLQNRASELYEAHRQRIFVQTDRLMTWLMLVQWLFGIVAALWISPRTWLGAESSTHIHVYAAIFLGAAITSFPVYLAHRHPGEALTRHVIAAAQM